MLPTASAQVAPSGSAAQAPKGGGAAIRLPPTASLSLAQLSELGHAASLGRTRVTLGAATALVANRDRKSGCRAMAAAIPLIKFRLCILITFALRDSAP